MAKPPRLAMNMDKATERVQQAAYWLSNQISMSEIIRFYECSPAIGPVEDNEGNSWDEGRWGVELLVYSMSLSQLIDLADDLEVEFYGKISMGDVDMYPGITPARMRVCVYLSGRVEE